MSKVDLKDISQRFDHIKIKKLTTELKQQAGSPKMKLMSQQRAKRFTSLPSIKGAGTDRSPNYDLYTDDINPYKLPIASVLQKPNYKVYNLPKISSLDSLPPVQKLVSKQHTYRQKLPIDNQSQDSEEIQLNKYHSLKDMSQKYKRKPSKIKNIQMQLDNYKYLDKKGWNDNVDPSVIAPSLDQPNQALLNMRKKLLKKNK